MDLRQDLLSACNALAGEEGASTAAKSTEAAVRALVVEISTELDELAPNAEFARQRVAELLEAAVRAATPDDAYALTARAEELNAEVGGGRHE
jgi:hypothetical protein